MAETEQTLFAGVVVEAPLTKIYHYRVPARLAGSIGPGDRVEAPFGRRSLRGVVVSVTRVPPIDPALIKEIGAVSAEGERIPKDILDLTRWIADYYRCGWGQALAAAVPAGVKHGRREKTRRRITLAVSPDEALAKAGAIARRAPRQAQCLRALAELFRADPARPVYGDDDSFASHAGSAALTALAEKGLIAFDRETAAAGKAFQETDREIILTPDQTRAIDRMGGALDGGGFAPFLLHGATGSGKTEVYMRLVARALEAGKGALVLVPEISLTPQTVGRFKRRFGDLAVLHSHQSEGERAEHWRRLRSGGIRLAVGARSAVFAPLRGLGLIIVDEEHERTYKQDATPRYHARDAALVRAKLCGATAVLGSATPSLESWRNAGQGKLELLSMPSRAGGAAPPRVEVVDLRAEWADVKQPVLLSRTLERELAACLARREQAILFLNRRGFHTIARCSSCGDPVECVHCDIALTHHRSRRVMRCGYCGGEQPVPDVCPTCGSPSLRFGGAGTERIEDVLRSLFPAARLLRMDSDSMSARDSHASALASFSRREHDILLGTQMVAKGLDFPNVTLVGVLMADAALGMTDFRAAERTFQLVAQVIGRAGRAEKEGLAVVQAFQPEHPAVAHAVKQDYHSFVGAAFPDRRRRGYPPFGRLARILVSGGDAAKVRDRAAQTGGLVKRAIPPGCRLLGPAPCEIERIQGLYRHHLLLFAPDHRALAAWLTAAGLKFGEEGAARMVIDIDPATMQ